MTDQHLKRKITRKLTNKGYICYIPTSDDPNDISVVQVYADTWGKLLIAGIYPILTIDKNGYVMVWCPRYRIYKRLARLIKNCKEGDKVSMHDGNELNQLDENIIVNTPEPPVYDRSYLHADDNPYFAHLVDFEDVTEWPSSNNIPRFKQTI